MKNKWVGVADSVNGAGAVCFNSNATTLNFTYKCMLLPHIAFCIYDNDKFDLANAQCILYSHAV